MRRIRVLPVAAWVTALPAAAAANDTHYQSYLLGERALGLGGAFTALADDASGAFYNPAGTAHVASSSASLSLNVYGVEKRHVARGYTAVLDGEPVAIDFNHRTVVTLPTTAGLVRKFGPRLADGVSRTAAGFATYLRYSTQTSVDAVLAPPGMHCPEAVSCAAYTATDNDRTLWIGPFAAHRLTERLSVGLAGFYSYRTVRRERKSERTGSEGAIEFFEVGDEIVAYTSADAFARLGARLDLTERLSLGLALSSPSFHVHGSGQAIQKIAFAEVSTDPDFPGGSQSYRPKENTGLDTRNPQPLEVRAGVAYGEPRRWLGALDVTFHGPVEFAPLDFSGVPEEERALVSLLQVPIVEREPVVDVNVGGEWYAGGVVPLRAGFFTGLSSAPEVVACTDDRPEECSQNRLPHVDMYGVTASAGLASAAYDASIGVLYAFGRGQAAAWDGATARFEPHEARNDFVYVYLSGAQKTLTKLAKKAVGKK